jgi:hypothetical protein
VKPLRTFASIEQLVPFSATHVERGDLARLGAELLDKGHDRKRIALAALHLDPAFHAPGAIGRVLLLADDPFKTHGAGALMDLYAASLQVLGVEDAFGGAGQQFSEHALALGKPHCAQIEPAQMEQVECVVEQPVLTARGEIGVQQSEIRDAA